LTYSPESAGQGSVGARAGHEPLDRGVAIAADEVLLAAAERAAHWGAGLACEGDRDEGVVAGVVLGAEASAHEVADDAHLVARQAEGLGDVVTDAPDVLRRDVDLERVTLPAADRLMSLHRVVEHGLRSILPLDDDIRLCQRATDVAALVVPRLVCERLLADRLLGIEKRLEHLPLDVDQRQRLASTFGALSGDRRDGGALVGRLLLEHVAVLGPDRAAHPRRLARPRQV
jgi:hypothetical protein